MGSNQIDLDEHDFQTAKRVLIFRFRSKSFAHKSTFHPEKNHPESIEQNRSNSQDVIIDRSSNRMGYV